MSPFSRKVQSVETGADECSARGCVCVRACGGVSRRAEARPRFEINKDHDGVAHD